jgi:xanthine/CO dehydrogenase XdhC/CoxF family maturation factor
MSDIHAIASAVRRLRAEQIPYLVATVVEVTGSSYRRPGARMIIGEDGSIAGGISAGCLESALVRTAWWRTRNERAVLVTYESTSDNDELGWGSGFGCNGVVEVLLERAHHDRDAALDFLFATVDGERRGALTTVFRSSIAAVPVGSRACTTAEGATAFLGNATWGPLWGEEERLLAAHVLHEGWSQTLVLASEEGCLNVLMEPVVPPPRLFICGEGPDAVPLARFARDLGWSVVIWASEPRWLSRERFHGVGGLSTGTPRELRAAVDASARPAVVVLSHRFERDRDLVGGLLGSKASYVGVLGPRARTARLLAEIGREAAPLDVLGCIRAPIGLDIGAETPSEIALSVLAEIQATLNGASAEPLSRRRGRIHPPSRAGIAEAEPLVASS